MEHLHPPTSPEQAPAFVGPETAWYWARLRRKRRVQRIMGGVISGLDIALLVSEFWLLRGYNPPLSLFLMLLSLLPLLQGLSLLVVSRGPVTIEAVEQLRRQERIQLFRHAQGMALPWQYRSWVLVFEFMLGLLLVLSTGQIIIGVLASRPLNLPVEWLAWSPVGIFFLLGLLLVIDSMAIKPRRARNLVKRSSSELAYRLSLGEMVTDAPTETEQ